MGSLIERIPYDCRKCGKKLTEKTLSNLEPVTMAYDLAAARLCFFCYGRDLETSATGGDTDA